jgi:hypothetical protein
LSTFPKNHRGNIFEEEFVFRVDFFPHFFFNFDFFVALVKRLSVRGTQKRDKKCFAGLCVYIFLLAGFVLLRFWAFLDQGNSKTQLKKKSRSRASKKKPGQIK